MKSAMHGNGHQTKYAEKGTDLFCYSAWQERCKGILLLGFYMLFGNMICQVISAELVTLIMSMNWSQKVLDAPWGW